MFKPGDIVIIYSNAKCEAHFRGRPAIVIRKIPREEVEEHLKIKLLSAFFSFQTPKQLEKFYDLYEVLIDEKLEDFWGDQLKKQKSPQNK